MNADLPVEYTCPLGHTCEKVVTDEITQKQKIVRCRWFTNIRGKHPQSEEVIDRFDCALAWQPILTIENTRQTMGAGAAIESFRNKVVAQNEELLV